MPSIDLRYRQVHLDFHTAPTITDVGVDFDPHEFAATVQAAQIDSMTVFAKCHHGYSYYPTLVGTRHPHLHFDLLGAQISALQSISVRAPIYLSVLWDDLAGTQHPEWIATNRAGSLVMRQPTSAGWGWTTMDIMSSYANYLLMQVEELCQRYPVDGFFFDICYPQPNYSPSGQARMQAAGVALDDDRAVAQYATEQLHAFFARTTALVRHYWPDATIFYNNTVTPTMARTLPIQTHFEVESLPTSGHWGYLHFPIAARQACIYGHDLLGMTGRFHKSWADFGGLKTSNQLAYECGTILAAGGRISVGDQLHPRGRLDPAVYRLLGQTFAQVKQLEPWLQGAELSAEIAIVVPEPPPSSGFAAGYSAEIEGAAQLLLELGLQFHLVDTNADFSRYATLLIPDGTLPNTQLVAKLAAYRANGGRLILSGTALLDTAGNAALDGMPMRYHGPAPTVPCYLRPPAEFCAGSELAADYDYVFYEQAHVVEPTANAVSYGTLYQALFNRSWQHFTSHAHAPVGAALNAPLAVRNADLLYLGVPLCRAYREHDYWAYREIFRALLREFLPPALLQPTSPGWVEWSLHTQPSHPDRQIIHAVAYQPRRSLQPIPHVDQAATIVGLALGVQRSAAPKHVYRAPERSAVAWHYDAGYVWVQLPAWQTHVVVVIE
jgi:hypothetical protein